MLAFKSFLKNDPLILSVDVEFLVIAAGGGSGTYHAGGGGGGGMRSEYSSGATVMTLDKATNYPLSIGAPGAAYSTEGYLSGGDSVFNDITSTGGGHGANNHDGVAPMGDGPDPGGSGGGAMRGAPAPATTRQGGTGNSPSTSPVQGYDGGDSNSYYSGAGGGGAGGEAPHLQNDRDGGNGGIPRASSITGTPVKYAGGGGGARYQSSTVGYGGGSSEAEGHNDKGGATDGTDYDVAPAAAAGVNTGGGAGAGGSVPQKGGAGGSGIVILAYPDSNPALSVLDGSHVCNGDGSGITEDTSTREGYRLYKFTAGSGNIQIG